MTSPHHTRAIGSTPVSSIALGCASLSLEHHGDPARGAAVIDAALDAGITLLDTAAAYAPDARTTADAAGHNERLIRRVLAARSADGPRPLVSTKGGHFRDGDAFPVDASPAALRRHCDLSLQALGVEQIDLYFLHWPDPAVPIQDSVGALDDLRREGKIARIGVSNIGLAQLTQAQRAAPIAAVQNRFSLADPSGREVLEHCAATGTAFLAYSPLRGLGQVAPALSREIARIAESRQASAAQVALAWLLAQAPVVIPVVGATRPHNARDAAGAADVVLSAAELDALGAG